MTMAKKVVLPGPTQELLHRKQQPVNRVQSQKLITPRIQHRVKTISLRQLSLQQDQKLLPNPINEDTSSKGQFC